ncbi:MAG: hypothetical protein K2X28_01230 [Alphaproteobacteria bacterium]|nr:hypothetical protein [Alphaproteobacteria bacterium]
MIDKQYAKNLLKKAEIYQKYSRKRNQLFTAMITSGGLKPTMYSEEIITNHVKLGDLFKE